MDNMTQTVAHQTMILEMPKEILLEIFGYFVDTLPPRVSDRLILYNNRLVCRAFDRLISPLLCPVISVSLCSESIDRLEGLFRNPLIAQGVCGIAISLRFRPRGIATNFRRYHDHAYSILDNCIQSCDWHTEFQDYEEDDISEDAVTHRDYEAAWSKFAQMQRAWQRLFKERSSQEAPVTKDVLEDIESINEEDKEAHDLLRNCFKTYAASYAEQARIVADGSFIRSITTALSCCGSLPFIWFNDMQIGKDWSGSGELTLAASKEALFNTMVQNHEWWDIEGTLCKDHEDTELFFPARIMTGLPIACHNAGVKLRGIQIDCFPLLRGYNCLLPSAVHANDKVAQDPWAPYAAACHDLEYFNFGDRINRSPLRPERQSASDSAIINGFIGATCSGPHLHRLYLDMATFRVTNGSRDNEEERLYLASPILATLTSTHLRSITVSNVEICGKDLLGLVKSVSSVHLTDLYLNTVTLSSGRYAEAMDLLHDISSFRTETNASQPTITFNDLQGAEFGAPSTFKDDNDDWLWGPREESEAYLDRFMEHQQPALLKQLQNWVANGQADMPSPLSEFEVAQA
jgi:hypothetical protein